MARHRRLPHRQRGQGVGPGERIAYAFMLKFVRDAKSLIISIFALTFVLSLLIPHPFPAPSSSSPSSRSSPSPPATVTTTRASSASSCLPLPPGLHVLPDGRLHAQPPRCTVQCRGRRHEPVLRRLVPVHERALCWSRCCAPCSWASSSLSPARSSSTIASRSWLSRPRSASLSVKRSAPSCGLSSPSRCGSPFRAITSAGSPAIGVALAMPIIGEVLTPPAGTLSISSPSCS